MNKRSLKPTLPVFIILSSFLVSCSLVSTEAAPTASKKAVPTVAPADTPTATSAPTLTPVPTSTPNAEATIAAQSTQATDGVFAELGELLSDTDVPYKDGHLAWQQTEPISIEMTGPSSDDTLVKVDENLTAGDFIFKSDVTWEATGWMYCGAVFRSEPDLVKGKQYQFYFLRLSGLPVWYIDFYEDGEFKNTISKERSSREIDMANGAVNQFLVIAEGEKFTVYFNGVRQGRYFDNSKQQNEGAFGFFAWQESGKGSCRYENSWIWSLDS